ncbi:MAG: FAD-dependent oxidoreductase [Pirellulales bacterium]
MRIAIIGAGISGCLTARLLATRHDVTLYESGRQAGGHAKTVEVEIDGVAHPVDVAFMVYNRRTYPNFCRLLHLLKVKSRPSDMSFSVRSLRTGLEYKGGTLRGMFAQRSNALRPSFLRMLADIVRFNQAARQVACDGSLADELTVGEFLQQHRFGYQFVENYLTPMAAAIWSSSPSEIEAFPAKFLIGFFANHGLLQLSDRPQWRTIVGGSRNYVAPLLRGLGDRAWLGNPVSDVVRTAQGVAVHTDAGCTEVYDQVVLATHADQTLQLLSKPTPTERSVLSNLLYRTNRAVLHTDRSLMPGRRDAWASWNYRLVGYGAQPATVTYDLSRLQGLSTSVPLLLTLNESASIDVSKVLREFTFAHPAYSVKSIAAQRRWAEVSGVDRVHYCGAYWGFGFHEDGVNSALSVANHFGIDLEECTAACTKVPSHTDVASR